MKIHITLAKNSTFLFLAFLGIITLLSARAAEIPHSYYKPNTKLDANKQLVDVVPDRFLLNKGTLDTEIYVANSPSPYPKVSTDIFNGLLSIVQSLSNIEFFGALFLFIAFFLFILWKFKTSTAKIKPLFALGLTSVISIFFSLRLSEGWDELFINLRHPYMLLEHGIYSINANSLYEGTVDFLPLMLTAFLAWIGLGLINALLVMSLLGNVLLVVFTFFLVSRITKNDNWGLISALLIGLYPNVLFIGASGFSATFFCGVILASSYFLLYTDKRKIGLLLLSSLTLIRTEGILFACLLLFYIDVVRPLPSIIYPSHFGKTLRKWLVDGFTVSFPFLLSLAARFYVYGHPIPTPITLKNTNLDHFYLINGGRQLKEIFFTHDLYITTPLIVLLWLFLRPHLKGQLDRRHLIELKKLLGLCFVTAIFILPYFIGGGDWFPIFWNRYALPFNLILSITFLILIYEFFMGSNSKFIKTSMLAFMTIFCAMCWYLVDRNNPSYSLNRVFEVATQKNGQQIFQGGNWMRIDRYSNLGQFLNKSLPLDATVASSEEATIMYFSKREMVGLLGVSNPEIASMPLQPLNPGGPFHRRRAYASVYRLRPDVIALFELDVLGDFSDPNSRLEKARIARNGLFSQVRIDTNYYIVGSFEALNKMGYHHFTLVFDDRIFSLFINDRIYEQFISNIKSEGFSYAGVDKIEYQVSPGITKRFVPAVDALMIKL